MNNVQTYFLLLGPLKSPGYKKHNTNSTMSNQHSSETRDGIRIADGDPGNPPQGIPATDPVRILPDKL